MKTVLEKLNWVMAGLLVCAALFATLEPMDFLGDTDWPQPLVLLGLLAGTLLLVNRLRYWVTRWSPRTYRRVLGVIWGLIIVSQVAMALSFVDVGRADGYFVRNQAITLAQGSRTWAHYFAVYPNNVNYTLVEATALKWLLPWTKTPWVLLNLVRYAWLDTGVVAGLWLLKHWRRWLPGAFWFSLLWLLSIPVYALGLFDYTDAVVFPLVIDSLALVTWATRQTGWRHWSGCLATVLLLAAGVAMKSNMIVFWLAVGVLILLLGWQRRLSWQQVTGWVTAAVLVLATVMLGMGAWRQHQGYRAAPNDALPVTSWMAMSMNPQGEGTYQLADFLTVNREPTAAAKQAKAQTMLRQRIAKLGVSGTLVHLMKKFRVFWSTGDFDSFKLTTQWLRAPGWYLNHQREVQFWLVIMTQLLYLTLLVQTIWVLLTAQATHVSVSFLVVAMLGLMIFHVLLWEVEPRYAGPLLPALMLLGTLGWCQIPSLKLSPSQSRHSRWFAGFLLALCALSLGQTSENTVIRQDTQGRQGNGDYFTLPTRRLARGERLTFTVPVTGPANALQLQIHPTNWLKQIMVPTVQPTYPKSTLRVQLHVAGRLVKTWKTTPTKAMAKPLIYPRRTASSVTVTLINTGRQPIAYAEGIAHYNQHTGEILPRTATYPQLYVENVHGPHALTGGAPILLVMGSFSLAVLWALRPSDPRRPRHFLRKAPTAYGKHGWRTRSSTDE